MTIVNETTVQLGCDPQVLVTIRETDEGSLIINLSDIDGLDPSDIDGFFFDLTDESAVTTLDVFPFVNSGPITDFLTGDDDVTTLANGATVAEGYDVALQFGTTPDSTEGSVTSLGFTLFSDGGEPLSIDDIDLTKLALVIDSDDGEGKVLLPNDGSSDDPDSPEADPGVCTFTIADPSGLEVEVTLTELDSGEMEVSLNVPDGSDAVIGDLRGVFFNVDDESKLDEMTVTGADVTSSQFAADDVSDLGHGANINGAIVNQFGEFDGGVEIGTKGAGTDDIQSTTFVLSHPDGLSLEDFDGQEFAVRLTSVGTEDDGREESLKLVGTCEPSVPPEEDCDDEYDVAYVDPAPLTADSGPDTTTDLLASLMTSDIPEEDLPDDVPEEDVVDFA